MSGVDHDDPDEAIRRQAADWWSALRSHDDEATRSAFAAWRNADARHALVYDRLAQRWQQAAFIASSDLGRSRDLARASIMSRRPGLVWGSVAAAALVVMAAGYQWRYSDRGIRQEPRSARVIASEGGKVRKVRLSDGSMVTLGPATILRMAFGPERRLLRLDRGRARFDVAHDNARPFVVETGSGSVTARGTMFEVSLSGTTMDVRLFRGAVDVRGSAPNWREARALAPGDRVIVERGQPVPPLRRNMVSQADATGRMVVLDDTPLREAVVRIGGGSTALSIAPRVPDNLRITGAFRTGDLAGLAQAASRVFDLHLTIDVSGKMRLEPA